MRLAVALIAVLALAGGAAALALSAGGSEGEGAEPPLALDSEDVRAGSSAALAQCSDWKDGTEAERRATIDDIYAQINQAGADGPTPDMPADRAYEVFERTCAQDYAAGFRLYKLYARASAFAQFGE